MSIDLNAPEVQEAIKAAIKESTESLAEKNKELLNELKQARKNQEIKPEQLERLEQERDELKAQLDKTAKEARDLKTVAEKATKQLEAETGFTQKLLVDNGLSDVLVKAGVSNPAHLKAVKSMLASQVQIAVDGDNRVAKVGDKSLVDYVTEWAKSDEGKHFVSAQANNGGGAQGGGQDKPTQALTSVQKIAAGLAKL
jgi:predicted nuclease with TOPRIM domain